MTKEHTPTPWKVGYLGREIVSSVDTSVGKAYWKQDAAHIVKCVNMHDELVEALKRVAESGEFSCFNDEAWDVVNVALKKTGAL